MDEYTKSFKEIMDEIDALRKSNHEYHHENCAPPPEEPEVPINQLPDLEEPEIEEASISAANKHRDIPRLISNISFYLLIVLLVLTAFLFGTKEGANNILGFSYANVLTTSMQSEIPKGSFVLVKEVNAAAIKIGDDITYYRDDGNTITHRVITIYENYENSGLRGFVTKGIDNQEADHIVVNPANIVGVVQFHIKGLGDVLSFIANNVWIIVLLFVIFLLLTVTLRIFFSEIKKDKKYSAATRWIMRKPLYVPVKIDDNILRETENFTIKIIPLLQRLCVERDDYIIWNYFAQRLLRSGTGIGANLHAAAESRSRQEVETKIYQTIKDIGETKYWLELLYKMNCLSEDEYTGLWNECDSLKKTLTALLHPSQTEQRED